MYEIGSEKERFESNITPRFLAEATGLMEVLEGIDREGLSILASWVGRPMSRNSVLEELRERKLEAIQDEISEMVFVGVKCFVGSCMERKEELSVISIELVIDWWPRNDVAEWSCVKNEKKRTKDRALRNTIQKLKKRRFDVVDVESEGSRGEIWLNPG